MVCISITLERDVVEVESFARRVRKAVPSQVEVVMGGPHEEFATGGTKNPVVVFEYADVLAITQIGDPRVLSGKCLRNLTGLVCRSVITDDEFKVSKCL